MKRFKYFCEYIILRTAFFLFGLLSPDKASDISGTVGKIIGPRLKFSRVANRNLAAAMPELTEQERKNIIRNMWDNLGRVIGEYPHMQYLSNNRVQFEGQEILEEIKSSNEGSIILGAHLANWEMVSHALRELDLCTIVRLPNNPFTRELIGKNRGTELIPKSASGTRKLIKFLKEGRNIGIFIDQKYNEGIAVPFFNIPAMTSPASVQLAKKFSCPLVPVRFQRIEGANFKITFCKPLELSNKQGQPLSDTEALIRIHSLLEEWISGQPEQWIWLHRRWKNIS